MRLIDADDLIERINVVIEHGLADPNGLHPLSAEVVLKTINVIPSAQSEIIVCEDCKWRISENRKTTSLWLPCRALVTPDQFSCIYAERRR